MSTTMTASLTQLTNNMLADRAAGRWFAALWQAEVKDHAASHATLLGWLIGLPAGLDPAAAATAVLDYQGRQEVSALSAALIALLQQVAESPAARLVRHRTSRRSLLAH